MVVALIQTPLTNQVAREEPRDEALDEVKNAQAQKSWSAARDCRLAGDAPKKVVVVVGTTVLLSNNISFFLFYTQVNVVF